MKRIIALSVFFLVLLYSVSSLKVFTVEETGKISLRTQAQDPDNDSLIYTYSEPLDANGQWQTTYGDVGTYNSSVTVSDGSQQTTEKILIIVTKKQQKPIIESSIPDQSIISIDEAKTLYFEVNASDLNNDPLEYQWSVDGVAAGTKNMFAFEPAYDQQGHHSIQLVVSDGTDSATQAWDVQVNDVDLDALFDDIRDISLEETELVSLPLDSFQDLNLQYEISEPLGNDNIWQTGYGDAAEYRVTLYVSGKGYERKKTILLTITNKDRPPTISINDKKTIREDEQVQLLVDAQDPDGDNITFSADNLPAGAYFEGNSIVWQPGFDEVQKEKAFDYLLDNFHVLSKIRRVDVVATSNDMQARKQVKIVVRDVNQPFLWEPMPDVRLKEGEEIILNPSYTDPDNDKVSFAYSGYMVTNRKKTDFDDSGHYVVKITASDGYYTQTQFVDVSIENVNRQPQFKKPFAASVAEGQEIRINLDSQDPDGEKLTFSSDNLPENARIENDELIWTPSFEVSASETDIAIPITVSDGTSQITQDAVITVMHVNQAPEILESNNVQVALVGETVAFEVNAVDKDNDVLQYAWEFGLFEKYAGESTHARQFSSAGDKEISVIVSDGKSEAKKIWHVKVI